MTYKSLSDRIRKAGRLLEEASLDFPALDASILDQVRAQANTLYALSESVRQYRHIDPLTPAQAKAMTFIRQYLKTNGYAPTRQEIADGLGYANATAAQELVGKLAERGVINVIEGTARGIQLNKRSLS